LQNDWGRISAAAAAALANGDFSAAQAALTAAVALRPDHADSWFNLGYARRHANDYAGALDAYATAISSGLAGAEAAHVNRAIILSSHMGKMPEAEMELHKAIALNADFLPAWLNLGELHEDQGDADAARKAYERALTVAPLSGRAQARLAALTILGGDAGRAVAALEARCRAGLTRDDDALEILFAYGNALDAAARYDEAFEVITAANSLSANLRHPMNRYDPVQMEQLVDKLCALEPAAVSGADALDEGRGLFICGMFRSGSTVFEQLLVRHPDIAAGGELELIPAFVHARLRPYPEGLDIIRDDAITAMQRDYCQNLASICPASRYVTDKRPDNILHIGLIKRLFPNAKIIVTRRAPLDNLLSIFFLNFAETITYGDELRHIVHYMQQCDRLEAHWLRLYGDDIRTVDYEVTVTDPGAVLANIHDWLGLAPVDSAATLAAPVIRTPSNWQARGSLHHRSVDRWRNYQASLAAHHELLADLPKPGSRKI
jgi:tetratricopeptide (TPR) repeat protein